MRFIKEKIKDITTNLLNIHNHGEKKDIIILSSPRSGSTWLMELIYSQPKIKFINEPFNKYILDHNNFFPIETRYNYLSLNSKEKRLMSDYFKKNKPINHFGPVKVFAKDYNFKTNRRVIKIIRANNLIEWFLNETDFQIIYLIRHPIAQSISCMKRGHVSFYKLKKYVNGESEYFQNNLFLSKNLNGEQKEFLLEINKSGSKLEKFVTEWCLDNLLPLKMTYSKCHDLITITYEEMVLNPYKTIDLLYEKLNLEDKGRLTSKIKKPSKTTDSSTKETKNNIKRWNPEFLISKWRKKITKREEADLFEILKMFSIDAYKEGSNMPTKNLLNFLE